MSPKDQELNMKKQTEEGNRALPLFQNLAFFVRNCFHLLKKSSDGKCCYFSSLFNLYKNKTSRWRFFLSTGKGGSFFHSGFVGHTMCKIKCDLLFRAGHKGSGGRGQ